jgi:hypothetical protein
MAISQVWQAVYDCRVNHRSALLVLAVTSALPAMGQQTLDEAVGDLYKVISGPSGQKRDWDKMRSLFLPEARMIALGRTRSGDLRRDVITVEEYIKLSGPFLEGKGFFEKEIARRTEQFGSLAQVFSTYESRLTPEGKPIERGINSLQLVNDGKRWWIASIVWQGEDVNTKLPARYQKSGD